MEYVKLGVWWNASSLAAELSLERLISQSLSPLILIMIMYEEVQDGYTIVIVICVSPSGTDSQHVNYQYP